MPKTGVLRTSDNYGNGKNPLSLRETLPTVTTVVLREVPQTPKGSQGSITVLLSLDQKKRLRTLTSSDLLNYRVRPELSYWKTVLNTFTSRTGVLPYRGQKER